MSLSIVIPTYGRDEVLTDTVAQLLVQSPPAAEILVVDQTRDHGPPTAEHLKAWHNVGAIRWIRHQPPGTVGAMNRGLVEASGDVVLFLDDDIRLAPGLVAAHGAAHAQCPDAWAVVGQVLQPEDWGAVGSAPVDSASVRQCVSAPLNAERGARSRELGAQSAEHTEDAEGEGDSYRKDGKVGKGGGEGLQDYRITGRRDCGLQPAPSDPLSRGSRSTHLPALSDLHVESPVSCDSWAGDLTADLDFRFNGGTPAWVTNVMAGNLSVKRDQALAVGGFDANFTPPVSYRFETEFAKRLVAAGGRIRFEPRASIDHLRASRGGTRSLGSHLTSASPIHGVGDYYYALRCGQGWERLHYILRRPFREVRTRFHLRHPWYVPVKLVGELRALLLALRLFRHGPRLMPQEGR